MRTGSFLGIVVCIGHDCVFQDLLLLSWFKMRLMEIVASRVEVEVEDLRVPFA